jgi:hypothetical protein
VVPYGSSGTGEDIQVVRFLVLGSVQAKQDLGVVSKEISSSADRISPIARKERADQFWFVGKINEETRQTGDFLVVC